MAVSISEYEREALPELEALGAAPEGEAEFFQALSDLSSRGSMAAQNLGQAAGRAVLRVLDGSGTGTCACGGQCSSREAASEFEEELNPIRRIYPDAMMEHLGHAAAEAQTEAEAQALAGAIVPLAARIVPRAAPVILRAAPGLACGVARVVHALRRSPSTRALVRTVPSIVRNTAISLARQASSGRPVTPQTAIRTLAGQTARVLGSPRHAARVFRRSQQLDGQFHHAAGSTARGPCAAYLRCRRAMS